MNVVKTNPAMAPIKEFDRFFDRFAHTPLWPFGATAPAQPETVWGPPLDVSETPKEYVVRLEAPGVTRDDLDVVLDGKLLTLSGKRELHERRKDENLIWEERIEGRFTRTLRLPDAVQETKIEALYNDGVLTVKLPKMEPTMKNKITIK